MQSSGNMILRPWDDRSADCRFWRVTLAHFFTSVMCQNLLEYFRSRGAKAVSAHTTKDASALISAFKILPRRFHILQVVFPFVGEIEALVELEARWQLGDRLSILDQSQVSKVA
jgi:hypothetical protein